MSTPSTATATLPPNTHYYTHHHHHHQNYQSGNATAYRNNNNLSLNNISRTYAPIPPPHSTGSTTPALAPMRDPQRQLPPIPHTPLDNGRMSYAHSAASGPSSSSNKRQRSRNPNWDEFYRNGLPREVIVIDDSPPPHHHIPAKTTHSTALTSHRQPAPTTAQKPASKKRKPNAIAASSATPRYDPVHPDPVYHINHTPSNGDLHGMSTASMTTSTDRTTSAAHTTAGTSLGSQYSQHTGMSSHVNAVVEQPGQKRKRVTRKVSGEDAKRRDIEEKAEASKHYKPPPNPPLKASDVHVKAVHDRYPHNNKVDDDDGHYIVVPAADLTERYTIDRLLGQGTFGKVVQARDKKRNNTAVAIKIIRSVQKYRDASRIELRVLATLKANDEENRNRCIHLRDCFDYRGHICIVMDLLGQSVFDFLKSNTFTPFPNSQIQNFARQLFTSVAFLHDINLIHTDLKPENILLCNNDYQTFTYNRKIPSSTKVNTRSAVQRKVLWDTEIRLIDFGSATFQDEYHSSVVSTRHYRAPEIILGLGWSFPCDIWSIGCILVEFYTGDALFQTHDNLEHLAMMEAVVGRRVDQHLVQAVNKMNGRSGGNPAAKHFKRLKLDYPTNETPKASRRFVNNMKPLQDIIPNNTTFTKHFLDLLRKIFIYDPAERITAKEALAHPWFKELATADDGTEAIKIRKAREAEEEKHRLHEMQHMKEMQSRGGYHR